MKTLTDIGERQAIEYIFSLLSYPANAEMGPGDDCAAIPYHDSYILLTTDMIHAKTHIPKKMTADQLGWFITAINLSDIAAKGGIPQGILLAYGLPRTTTKEFLRNLTLGADRCASEFETNIIGGDLKESTNITLTGTAIGFVPKKEFMPRYGIKPGDIVAVTGKLGKASAGYHSLQLPTTNKIAQHDLFMPYPRINEGRILAKTQLISSSMDISDGLSSSLYQLQKINNVGFKIQKDSIPIAPILYEIAQETPIDIAHECLHFGGDYELLITLPADHLHDVQKSLQSTSTPLTTIGVATKNTDIIIEKNNKTTQLENKGYEHFLKK